MRTDKYFIHALHTCISYIHFIPRFRTCTSYIRFIHTYIHTCIHACVNTYIITYINFIHAFHTYISYIHVLHTFLTYMHIHRRASSFFCVRICVPMQRERHESLQISDADYKRANRRERGRGVEAASKQTNHSIKCRSFPCLQAVPAIRASYCKPGGTWSDLRGFRGAGTCYCC